MKKLARINDIGRLSIILPGYTLMDMLTAMIVALLSSVVYKDVKESSCAIAFRDAAPAPRNCAFTLPNPPAPPSRPLTKGTGPSQSLGPLSST